MPPTELDVQFAEWVEHLNIPRLVVATKADKISGNQRAVEKRAIGEVFPETPVVFSSSLTGAGCNEIWNRVVETTRDHKLREKSPRVSLD
jgi:GTP-binding protein